jgi:hypothetical protein
MFSAHGWMRRKLGFPRRQRAWPLNRDFANFLLLPCGGRRASIAISAQKT